MKPGSLVLCEYQHPKLLGIILRESKSHNNFVDKEYQWWEVFVDNKIIVEAEYYLKMI